jgi:hypothetical protein
MLKSFVDACQHRICIFFTIVLFCCGIFLCAALCHAQIPSGAWYKGDLHAHSLYSDGDSPVSAVIRSAEDRGLDFFVVTDHDTSLRGNPAHWDDPGYHSSTLVLLYGIEWTTPRGHANVWSAAPFSYAELWAANRARNGVAAAAAAHRQGALFSINHPSSLFTSSWQYAVAPEADSIEIWNTMYRFPSGNRRAGHWFWDDLLKSGRRIPCVGGSDTHQLVKWQSKLFGHGNPTTWIYAPERSGEALLDGIRAGHVSVSYAPDAPRLDFSADSDKDGIDDVMMGDNIEEADREISFTVRIHRSGQDEQPQAGATCELGSSLTALVADGQLSMEELLGAAALTADRNQQGLYGVCVYKNGALFRAWLVPGTGQSCSFSDSPGAGTWYRVELAGTPVATPVQHLLYGRILALTNPIYVGYQE